MIDNHGDDVKIIQRLKEEHFGMDDIDLGLERERERESCSSHDAMVDDTRRREIAEAVMEWWLN